MTRGPISSRRHVRLRPLLVAVLGALAVPVAHAQAWRTETGVRASETYSDNIGRQTAGTRSDWATEISPYLNLSGQSARSTAAIDARLQNWLHTDSQTDNRTSLQLSAFGNLELSEDFLFLDASLTNDRQRVSRFQAADASYGGTSNSTEVTRLSVAPYMRWHMGNSIEGLLRYRYENVHADDAGFAEGAKNSLVFNIRNGPEFGRVGWGFTATHTDSDAQTLEATDSDTYTGSLSYGLTPALNVTAFGGQEYNNYGTDSRQHYWNWGAGLRWEPDGRNSLGAVTTKRFFGRGFNYDFSHRMQNSALEWAYSRDLMSSSNTTDSGLALASMSPENYLRYQAALAAVDPSVKDPAERRRIALASLEAQGIKIFDLTRLNYVSSRNTITRSMRLAWVLNGVRNSLTLAGYSSDMETLSQQGLVAASDDLATYQRIKSRGWNVVWGHEVTTLTTLTTQYASLKSRGENVSGVTSSNTHNVSLSLFTRLAPFTSGGLSYNYSKSSGSFDYRENAVAAYINHRF